MSDKVATTAPNLTAMNSIVSIRNIQISPGLVLSPMSGVTCSSFRRLVKELNPGAVGMVVSEFISVEGLTRNSKRSMEMMRFDESERPYGIQIFGYDIDRMRDGALMAQDAGADVVDINCGCPAPKVVKRGGGCELMRQPEHLAKILRAVRGAVSIPVTMKFRSGWDEGSKNCLDIARLAEAEGMESLAIHGRTRSQLYRGKADWSFVEEVAETVRIPVFGSGDVVDAESATARLKGRIAGIYIGRGALENPFVFKEIVEKRPSRSLLSETVMVSVLERYIELLRIEFADRSIVGRFKQLVTQMCKGFEWRKDLCRAMTLEQQLDILARVKAGANSRPADFAASPRASSGFESGVCELEI